MRVPPAESLRDAATSGVSDETLLGCTREKLKRDGSIRPAWERGFLVTRDKKRSAFRYNGNFIPFEAYRCILIAASNPIEDFIGHHGRRYN